MNVQLDFRGFVHMLQKAKIIKVTTHDDIPKYTQIWMDNVEYHKDAIKIGKSVIMLCSDERNLIAISPLTSIEEDENNLILNTENCAYYLKKYK